MKNLQLLGILIFLHGYCIAQTKVYTDGHKENIVSSKTSVTVEPGSALVMLDDQHNVYYRLPVKHMKFTPSSLETTSEKTVESNTVSTGNANVETANEETSEETSENEYNYNDGIETGLNLINSVAKSAIESDTGLYEASFSGSCSGTGLYNDLKPNPPIIHIKRTVRLKKDEKTEKTAVDLTLTPEISPDGLAFRYSTSLPLTYNYSAAKQKRGFKYIDSHITIKFTYYTNVKGESKSETMQEVSLNLNDMTTSNSPQTKNENSGWILLPPISSTSTKVKCETDDKDCINGLKNSYTAITSETGNYNVQVTISEKNIYKSKAEARKNRFNTIAPSVIELATPVLIWLLLSE